MKLSELNLSAGLSVVFRRWWLALNARFCCNLKVSLRSSPQKQFGDRPHASLVERSDETVSPPLRGNEIVLK